MIISNNDSQHVIINCCFESANVKKPISVVCMYTTIIMDVCMDVWYVCMY